MSTLLWSLAKENPWPGLALASLNLVVALSLVGLSLLLGVTISLLAWLHAFVDREAVPIKRQAQRRGHLKSRKQSCHQPREPERCEQEIRFVNACARLSRFSNSRCGVIFCGSAERCSCCSLQPIRCCPRPCQASSSNRILRFRRSGSPPSLKGPEAVVIDTSQPDFLPMLPDKEIAAAPSPPLSSDVADAVRQPPAVIVRASRCE